MIGFLAILQLRPEWSAGGNISSAADGRFGVTQGELVLWQLMHIGGGCQDQMENDDRC